MVGPNESFLSYIGDVLPALGEIDATQATVSSLVTAGTGAEIRGLDTVPAALIKGDARMAEVLRRAVWSHLGRPEGRWSCRAAPTSGGSAATWSPRSSRNSATRGVRYAAGRAMLPQRLAHQVLLRMEASGDSPDDRVQNAVARSRPVRAYADALWPALDPAKLVLRLLTDSEFLAEQADGVLDAEEQSLIMMAKPARSVRAARWSLADVILIDETADLLSRTPSLGHVIVDEAQDLSAMQLRAVGRRASTGSVTVLGDLAQATTPWATRSWRSPSAISARAGGDPGAGRRLPGSGRGDRLRRPAAADDRPGADAAALGPPAPGRTRSSPGPAAVPPSSRRSGRRSKPRARSD